MEKSIKEFNKLLKFVPILNAKGIDVFMSFYTVTNCVEISIYPKGYHNDKKCNAFYLFGVGDCKQFAEEKQQALAILKELAK